MAATSVRGKIYEGFASRTVEMATALGLTVGLPNVKFDPPSRSGKRTPYLIMRVQPNGSSRDGLAFDSDLTHIGLLQISVYWPAGEGLLKPTDMAERVAGWWDAGTDMEYLGVKFTFDYTPTIAAALQESDLLQVPVTVRWRASEIKP